MAINAKQVAQAALECADSGAKMTDTLKAYMTGIPPAKREEKIKEVYTMLRTIGGKVTPAKELPDRENRAYAACRQAYGRLFPKKRGSKRRVGKATVTKVQGMAKAQVRVIATKPKKLADTLRVILATVQAEEKPAYKDVPALVAALQAAIDKAV